MRVEDITVEVRNADLTREGQIDMRLVTDMKIVKRLNNVGAWSLSLPADYPMSKVLAQKGCGLTVTVQISREVLVTPAEWSGGVFYPAVHQTVIENFPLLNGRTLVDTTIQTNTDPHGNVEFTGVDDMIHLADALAWPQPSNPDASTQNTGHDVRTGFAETVMKEYVGANIGPGAPVSRRIPELLVETDLARGPLVTGRARFDQLGLMISQLASLGPMGFDIIQVGQLLQFSVYEPQDVSGTVRMDIFNDTLTEVRRGKSAPTATRIIVAGQGELEDRRIIQVTDAEAALEEAAWRRKIEVFRDARDTPDDTELEQRGMELLLEGGRTINSLSVKPSDDQTMEFVKDWYLGDIVQVIIEDQPTKATVTEAIIAIGSSGIMVGATVGNPTGFDFNSQIAATASKNEERIAFLEKNAEVYSGVYPLDRIPDLPASKTTSGIFAIERIPDIQASKLTGYVDDARLTQKALLDPAYRGPGPAKITLLSGGSLSATAYSWLTPYVPTGSRVVNVRKSGTGWVIEGQDDGGVMPLTLASGWGTYNDSVGDRGWALARSQRLPSGIVLVSGMLRNSGTFAAGSLIATLAPGHRPDRTMIFAINNGDTPKYVTIQADGKILFGEGAVTASYVSFDGNIAFPAAGVASWTYFDPQGTAGSDHAFANGWVDYVAGGGMYGRAGFWTDPYGFTWTTGMVKNGTTADNTVIGYLPEASRAAWTMHIATAAYGGGTGASSFMGIVGAGVSHTGVMFKAGTVGNGWFSLFGPTFPTALAFSSNPWKPVTFNNSWQSFPTTAYVYPSVLRRGDGLTTTQGMLQLGTMGARAFFVPDECVPPRQMLMQTASNAARGRADITGFSDVVNPPGSFVPQQGTNGWYSIDSLKYMVQP